jgi:hypothetical protein
MDMPDGRISEQQCWNLLASRSVGRVALSVQALPAIMAVQYYLEGKELAVCLGHREIPESSLDGAVVAFAADAIDPKTRTGWSAAGQVLRIQSVLISGYEVHLCPFIDALVAGGTENQAP